MNHTKIWWLDKQVRRRKIDNKKQMKQTATLKNVIMAIVRVSQSLLFWLHLAIVVVLVLCCLMAFAILVNIVLIVFVELFAFSCCKRTRGFLHIFIGFSSSSFSQVELVNAFTRVMGYFVGVFVHTSFIYCKISYSKPIDRFLLFLHIKSLMWKGTTI